MRTSKILLILILNIIAYFPYVCQNAHAEKFNVNYILNKIGQNDSFILANMDGHIIAQKNSQKNLIPASILKIFTSLLSIKTLGPDYRFKTEFYLDKEGKEGKEANLYIKGFGDPLFVSEVIFDIAHKLSGKIKKINHIYVDDSYFKTPIQIPGITYSTEPYDAPNGALCANFNSVFFKKQGNAYTSAEPQTPLLPFVTKHIKSSNLKKGRIIFSHHKNEIALYVGHLFAYFLKQDGVNVSGAVKMGAVDSTHTQLIYSHTSPFKLTELIQRLLTFSNNFMANQLLIQVGIHGHSPPGDLEKGVNMAKSFARKIGLKHLKIVEGSGISRKNRICAAEMLKVLYGFQPYYQLLQNDGPLYYKTGTLHGINTRAGYIQSANGRLYPFVLMLNTKGKRPEKIMKHLARHAK